MDRVHQVPKETSCQELISEGFDDAAVRLFRTRIDAMINLNDPLVVLATRLPWRVGYL